MANLKDIDLSDSVDWNIKLTKNIAEMIRSEMKQGFVQLRAEMREVLREPLKQIANVIENSNDLLERFTDLEKSVQMRAASMDKLTSWATNRRGLEEGRDRKVERLTKAVEKLLGDTNVDVHSRPTPPRDAD